jgi:hypothetical protein
MPPMPYSLFQSWISFLYALNGQACVFQLGSALQAAYPLDFGDNLYWRLKQNSVQYAIRQDRIYTLSFECRQAI